MLKISNEYDVHRRSITQTDFHQRLRTFINGAQPRVKRWQTSAQTYVSVIRPVLEYACPVWHTSLPMYLSDNIETIQKRCLRTIFPGHSYDEARSISNLPTLFERRTKLCQSYFRKMHNADHKLNKLLPNQRNILYDLRTYNTLPVPLARTDRFRRSLIPWGLANWQHNVL